MSCVMLYLRFELFQQKRRETEVTTFVQLIVISIYILPKHDHIITILLIFQPWWIGTSIGIISYKASSHTLCEYFPEYKAYIPKAPAFRIVSARKAREISDRLSMSRQRTFSFPTKEEEKEPEENSLPFVLYKFLILCLCTDWNPVLNAIF
jgi:hypothetical protein